MQICSSSIRAFSRTHPALVLSQFGGHIVKGNASLLELGWGAIAQGGMKAMAIAEDRDELEDAHLGFVLGGIGLAVHALTLQGGIEAPGNRAVEAIPDAPYARLDPMPRQPTTRRE